MHRLIKQTMMKIYYFGATTTAIRMRCESQISGEKKEKFFKLQYCNYANFI